MSLTLRLEALAVILLAIVASPAVAEVLYSGSGTQTPNDQGWIYMTNPIVGASATNTAVAGVTMLYTTGVRSDQAGYFSEFPVLGSHPLMPTLDRTAGYIVRFTLGLVGESHDATDLNGDTIPDRGGFSIIALSSDSVGIEIAFWDDLVWAYDYADIGGGTFEFVHAENATGFIPPAALTNYELAVSGSTYTLSAAGSQILAGSLRNYSGEGWPYTNASFLFLGDDTSSADSHTLLSFVEVVPEPATMSIMLAAGFPILLKRRRSRR